MFTLKSDSGILSHQVGVVLPSIGATEYNEPHFFLALNSSDASTSLTHLLGWMPVRHHKPSQAVPDIQ